MSSTKYMPEYDPAYDLPRPPDAPALPPRAPPTDCSKCPKSDCMKRMRDDIKYLQQELKNKQTMNYNAIGEAKNTIEKDIYELQNKIDQLQGTYETIGTNKGNDNTSFYSSISGGKKRKRKTVRKSKKSKSMRKHKKTGKRHAKRHSKTMKRKGKQHRKRSKTQRRKSRK